MVSNVLISRNRIRWSIWWPGNFRNIELADRFRISFKYVSVIVHHFSTSIRCTNRRLEVYRNLETLELVTPIDLNLEPILNLPAKLKVVRLDESDLIPILSYETSYRVMNHFIQQKKLHRKKKLKIYFLDTLLDENNKRFEDYDCVKNYKFTDLKEFVNDFINEMHSDSSKPTKQPDNHPITTIKTIGIVLIVLLYRYFNWKLSWSLVRTKYKILWITL